jgi:nucleoside-diphosphate-sugar epimerase
MEKIKKTILLVGGAGYIGSHMALALQDAGYSIICRAALPMQ